MRHIATGRLTGRQTLALCFSMVVIIGSFSGCSQDSDFSSTNFSSATYDLNPSSVLTPEGGSSVEPPSEKTPSLETILKSVKNAYGENYIPNMQFTETDIKGTFGLKSDLYEDVLAEGSTPSTNTDTFVAVKAKEGKAEKVEALLTQYRDSLTANSGESANKLKIQSSRVISEGNYVFFLLLGSLTPEQEALDESDQLDAYQQQAQIGEDAIRKAFDQ